jgi:hypothetical protein
MSDTDIIAAGPRTLHLNGHYSLRTVLRDLSIPGHPKFVIHTQVFPDEGERREPFFDQGDYIENPYKGSATKSELLREALEVFVERCNRTTNMDETADISEGNGEPMPGL